MRNIILFFCLLFCVDSFCAEEIPFKVACRVKEIFAGPACEASVKTQDIQAKFDPTSNFASAYLKAQLDSTYEFEMSGFWDTKYLRLQISKQGEGRKRYVSQATEYFEKPNDVLMVSTTDFQGDETSSCPFSSFDFLCLIANKDDSKEFLNTKFNHEFSKQLLHKTK